MDSETKKPVTTIEGIAIHVSYINDHLKSLDEKMTTIASNTVNRDEWTNHLKDNEDKEARIRSVEKEVSTVGESVETVKTTIRVWGTVITAGLAIIEIVLRYLIK